MQKSPEAEVAPQAAEIRGSLEPCKASISLYIGGWDGVPFDGVTPSVAQAAVFLTDNGITK